MTRLVLIEGRGTLTATIIVIDGSSIIRRVPFDCSESEARPMIDVALGLRRGITVHLDIPLTEAT